MALWREEQLDDDLADSVGLCLRELHSMPTWTAKKFQQFARLVDLLATEGYLQFQGDYRDYRLDRKGQHCLYVVPLDQRGALQPLAGRRIRLICGDATNPYSGRIFYVKPID